MTYEGLSNARTAPAPPPWQRPLLGQ